MKQPKELIAAKLDLKMANLSHCDACYGHSHCDCECDVLGKWREEALINVDRLEREAGMIDLEEMEARLISAKILLALDKGLQDEGEVIAFVKEWKKVIAELRAAREVVAYFREWNGHSDECDRSPCDCGYSEDLEVLKKYDEARQG